MIVAIVRIGQLGFLRKQLGLYIQIRSNENNEVLHQNVKIINKKIV